MTRKAWLAPAPTAATAWEGIASFQALNVDAGLVVLRYALAGPWSALLDAWSDPDAPDDELRGSLTVRCDGVVTTASLPGVDAIALTTHLARTMDVPVRPAIPGDDDEWDEILDRDMGPLPAQRLAYLLQQIAAYADAWSGNPPPLLPIELVTANDLGATVTVLDAAGQHYHRGFRPDDLAQDLTAIGYEIADAIRFPDSR